MCCLAPKDPGGCHTLSVQLHSIQITSLALSFYHLYTPIYSIIAQYSKHIWSPFTLEPDFKTNKSTALYHRTVHKFLPVLKELMKPANRNRVRQVDKEMTSSKLCRRASWASPALPLCQKHWLHVSPCLNGLYIYSFSPSVRHHKTVISDKKMPGFSFPFNILRWLKSTWSSSLQLAHTRTMHQHYESSNSSMLMVWSQLQTPIKCSCIMDMSP